MRRRRRKTQPRAATPKVAALDTNQGKAPQFPFPLCRGGGSRQGGALGGLGAYRQGLRERKGRESRGTALPRQGRTAPVQGPPGGAGCPSQTWRRRHQNGNCLREHPPCPPLLAHVLPFLCFRSRPDHAHHTPHSFQS